jgi:hypothetical protein
MPESDWIVLLERSRCLPSAKRPRQRTHKQSEAASRAVILAGATNSRQRIRKLDRPAVFEPKGRYTVVGKTEGPEIFRSQRQRHNMGPCTRNRHRLGLSITRQQPELMGGCGADGHALNISAVVKCAGRNRSDPPVAQIKDLFLVLCVRTGASAVEGRSCKQSIVAQLSSGRATQRVSATQESDPKIEGLVSSAVEGGSCSQSSVAQWSSRNRGKRREFCKKSDTGEEDDAVPM